MTNLQYSRVKRPSTFAINRATSSQHPDVEGVINLTRTHYNHTQRTTQCSYFLVCWAIPGPPFMTTVMAFERRLPVGDDPTFDTLFEEFRSGTDDQRRSRFKYIPSLKVAPWMVSARRTTLSSLKKSDFSK